MAAQRMLLPNGRWHFQHGPMDIVIGAEGRDDAVRDAHERAFRRFASLLDELVDELPQLRSRLAGPCLLHGPVARRMWQACQPFSRSFITSMAAVAGSVAEELIASYRAPGITRAWVNNGGDIALHVMPGHALRVGLYSDISRLDVDELHKGITTDGQFDIDSALPVRGIATSGWRGRSFSLGIADSVTVLARTASQADAAATVIANAVNVDDARITRRPACDLKDDSDLGTLPVTVDVPLLEPLQVQRALRAGLRRASELQAAGLLWSVLLVCQKQVATTSQRGSRIHAAATDRQLDGSVFA